jgi:hypothetical protein
MIAKTPPPILMAALLLTGMLLGILFQRSFGLGNLLRIVGVGYPTRTPEEIPARVTPTPLPSVPGGYQGKLALFILAGQSNMSGYAPIPEEQHRDGRAFVFGNNYRWDVAAEPVDDSKDQVDPVSIDNGRFGPSLAFALASLERQPQTPVGLIPCAKGATSILEWQRDLSDQSLYGSCLKRAKAASPMGYLAGLLFFQGEQDAVNTSLYPQFTVNAERWSELFSTFVEDMRLDLDEPDLPVIYAQLGPTPEGAVFPEWEVVKQQQLAVNLPDTVMIVTDDLDYFDGLHFTVESYQVIGRRFADAYWNLVLEGE